MQRHIRPCQVAESERRQSARHPVRIAGRRDGPSVRASLMLTGYGGRQCPSCSAHCLSAVSFQPTFGRETILGWGKSEIESRIDDRPTGWSSFWSRQIHGNPPLSHLVALLAAYVIVGNHLYLAKVLPALSRDGLDGSVKFMPSKQFDQIDVFLTRFPPTAPRPWFYGVLSHVRAISAALVAFWLVAFVAAGFFSRTARNYVTCLIYERPLTLWVRSHNRLRIYRSSCNHGLLEKTNPAATRASVVRWAIFGAIVSPVLVFLRLKPLFRAYFFAHLDCCGRWGGCHRRPGKMAT
jgi:hypothetical protein